MWPISRKVDFKPPSSRRWPTECFGCGFGSKFSQGSGIARIRRDFGHFSSSSDRLVQELSEEVPSGEGVTARTEELARLETILFVAREPLGSRKLAQLANLEDGTAARSLVGTLNQLYDAERRAFRVIEVGGGFQLRTRPQFGPWLTRLHSATIEVRLSAPAMETLAVVAYRQPVLRATIEAIRGVQCGEMLRQLMERDLVRIAGRSLELGRPFLYGTTKRFLQVFGLGSIDDLPHQEWFASEPDETLPEVSQSESFEEAEQNDQESEPTEPITDQ